MTLKEAKIFLLQLHTDKQLNKSEHEALRLAIKALEKEPCEDAINRQAVIEVLNKMDRYVADELTLCDTEKKFPKNEVFIVDDIYEQIAEQLPSVTPQRKVGKWISVENEEMKTVGYYCSECDLPMETEYRTKFCPNCGQRKTEVSENE